ncbi:DUF3040 domain-containing protein [Nonomuraea sp. NPDC050643]|uniref:DUF3040 domain-containing protein n=1 Tax=Nonomuraea sp. NPDC050643 TaxID=3155660 RepID=UPI0033ED6483
MDLSDAERRALAEIEQGLRGRDRAFARRMDLLSSAPHRHGAQRFACPVTRREFVGVIVAVLGLIVLQVVVVFVVGGHF